MNLFEQNKQKISKNLQESYLSEEEVISKSIDSDLLCKGKKAQIGEIRTWNGKKMQKTTNGWVPAERKGSEKVEEHDQFEKFKRHIESLDDVDLEDKFLKVGNALMDSNGKLPKLEDLDDDNDRNLRQRLSLMSKEMSKRGIH